MLNYNHRGFFYFLIQAIFEGSFFELKKLLFELRLLVTFEL